MIVLFAVRAEVAGGRYAECLGRTPFSVCPDGCSFSISARKVIACILAVVDDTHRDTLSDIPGFQKTAAWILHEEGDVEILSQI